MLSRKDRHGRRGVITLGAAVVGDISAVRTWHDFAAYLQRIRRRSAMSLQEVESAGKRLASSDRRYRLLPVSTVSDALNGKTQIKRDLLVSLLEVLQVPRAERHQILDTWQLLTATVGQGPPGAGRVDEASPRDLGVHAAIQISDGATRLPGENGQLPSYVERDFDAQLHQQIVTGTQDGCFVLLMGGSSCGKTRSLYEAVSGLVPDWWLVQPSSTREIRDLLTMPTASTVLWLDDFHRFLGADPPLRHADIIALRKAKMIVVGTVWHKHYHSRKRLGYGDDDDIYAEDRKLIELAEVITVPEALSPGERRRATKLAKGDTRIRTALAVTDVGFTQVLAAGPDLVRRWEQAPNPYCRAILTAAADARRLGVQGALSVDVLTTAMTGYLSRTQRVPGARLWLERGLQAATTPLYGEVSALFPVAPETGKPAGNGESDEVVADYSVADYLTQHIGRLRRNECPPHSLWEAVATETHDLDDLRRLASAALARMRYAYAERALRRLHEAGDDSAGVELITLLRRQGRMDEAIVVAEALLAANPADQRRRILRVGLVQLWARAEQLREQAATDPLAADRLAELLDDGGKADELRARAEDGNAAATEDLVELLAERGGVAGLRELAAEGNRLASIRLAELLAIPDQVDIPEPAHSVGSSTAVRQPAQPAASAPGVGGDHVEQLRASADGGDEKAANELTGLLFDAGDRAGLLAEVNAGTHRAAERYLALLTADLAIDRRDVRAVQAFGLSADGRPAAPRTTP